MKTLVLANQKGGVGKSAVVTQLAHYLFRVGASVLVIDLDHQQNSSRALRGHRRVCAADFSATDLFEAHEVPPLPSHRFVLVSGDDRLSSLERQADRHSLFAGRLRAALRAWDRFDVCLIDTNPNPDIRYAAALVCANHILVPIQLNQEAIEGIAGLIGHPRYGISKIQSVLNPTLDFMGLLPNVVEATPFQRANLHLLMKTYGARLLSSGTGPDPRFGFIPKRTAIPEAQAAGTFLGDMTKTSARDAWREIRPVFDMIIARLDIPTVSEKCL